jgi:hypothetical protein
MLSLLAFAPAPPSQPGWPTFIFFFGLLGLGMFLYILPSLIALNRRHRNKGPIIVVDLLLGWTLVGWVVSLAWSLSSDVEPKPQAGPPPTWNVKAEADAANVRSIRSA